MQEVKRKTYYYISPSKSVHTVQSAWVKSIRWLWHTTTASLGSVRISSWLATSFTRVLWIWQASKRCLSSSSYIHLPKSERQMNEELSVRQLFHWRNDQVATRFPWQKGFQSFSPMMLTKIVLLSGAHTHRLFFYHHCQFVYTRATWVEWYTWPKTFQCTANVRVQKQLSQQPSSSGGGKPFPCSPLHTVMTSRSHCMIGTSLSEPHTSVTALCMYVCMLACGHIA